MPVFFLLHMKILARLSAVSHILKQAVINLQFSPARVPPESIS